MTHETFQTPVNTKNKPLCDGSKISLEEGELLLIMFSLKHKLTARALDDLINLVNYHTPYRALFINPNII